MMKAEFSNYKEYLPQNTEKWIILLSLFNPVTDFENAEEYHINIENDMEEEILAFNKRNQSKGNKMVLLEIRKDVLVVGLKTVEGANISKLITGISKRLYEKRNWWKLVEEVEEGESRRLFKPEKIKYEE